MNICQPINECYNCDEYTGAFECLNKTKISQMPELSELQMQDYLDRKCSDIIIPVVSKDCEDSPKNYGLSLKQLVESLRTTSIGIRENFADKEFTSMGQVEIYELSLQNNHPTKSMQMSYFFTWSSTVYSTLYPPTLLTKCYVDGEIVAVGDTSNSADVFGDANTNWVFVNGLGGTVFFTKVLQPNEKTTSKIEFIADHLNEGGVTGDKLKVKGIQLMITGVTK